MRNKRIIRASVVLIALFVAGFLFQAAWAGSFHFKSVSFSLGSLVMDGDLVGLGNKEAEVTLTGYGYIRVLCENNGGNQAPGRNPVFVNTQRTGVFTTNENGFAEVLVAAPDPTFAQLTPTPTAKQAGCPNNKWTVVDVVDGTMNWTKAGVIIKDEFGVVQQDLTYTCTTSFTNGVATGVSCLEN